jgi:hypothetical protein
VVAYLARTLLRGKVGELKWKLKERRSGRNDDDDDEFNFFFSLPFQLRASIARQAQSNSRLHRNTDSSSANMGGTTPSPLLPRFPLVPSAPTPSRPHTPSRQLTFIPATAFVLRISGPSPVVESWLVSRRKGGKNGGQKRTCRTPGMLKNVPITGSCRMNDRTTGKKSLRVRSRLACSLCKAEKKRGKRTRRG